MKYFRLCFALIFADILAATLAFPATNQLIDSAPNEFPIIGILAQEENTTNSYESVRYSYKLGNESTTLTYIAASYVKFVEAGGARVVPIHIGRPNNSYTEVFSSINGFLIPGGNISIYDSFYASYGRALYVFARSCNDLLDFFPIWATGTGFHLLASLLLYPQPYTMDNCTAWDMPLPLNLTPDAATSRLFSNLPADVSSALTTENVTANYHYECLTPQTVASTNLQFLIRVLSTNFDADGKEFVSTYEVVNYPFYATQWHPEKAPWEWPTGVKNIPHSANAVRVAQYFALFFANEARKSYHTFGENVDRETAELIYNLNPTYSGRGDSEFVQIYDFFTG